jgi:hypothetical protein
MGRSATPTVVGEEDCREPVTTIFGEKKHHTLFAILHMMWKTIRCTRSSWNKKIDTREYEEARYTANCLAMPAIQQDVPSLAAFRRHVIEQGLVCRRKRRTG